MASQDTNPESDNLVDTHGGAFIKDSVYVEKGDFVGRDKIVNIGNIPNLIDTFKSVVIDYIVIFLSILLVPWEAFNRLLIVDSANVSDTSNQKKLDEFSIAFAAIGLLIGILLASGFSIEGSPNNLKIYTLATIIVPFLFIGLLYSVAIHYLAVLVGGKAHIYDTVSSYFYVFGTIHPIMVFVLVIFSFLISQAVTYSMLLEKVLWGWGVNPLSPSFKDKYILISTLLMSAYLYWPIKMVHKLPNTKMLFVYVLVLSPLILRYTIPNFHLIVMQTESLFVSIRHASMLLFWNWLSIGALIYCAYKDIWYRRIPNRITYSFIFFSLIITLVSGQWPAAVLGGLFAAFILFIPQLLLFGINKVGMGTVKLATLGGILIGPSGVLEAFTIACVTAAFVMFALVVTKQLDVRKSVPFGPFLSFGFIIMILYTTLY